jgi:hypothetical protein
VGYVSSAGGSDTYSGDLLATTGSPFSANPYNPSAFTFTSVGNITFTGNADGSATITYSVSGAQVSKRVTRQTWRANTIASTSYFGATNYVRSGCSVFAQNGPQNDQASYALTVTSNTFTLVEDNGTNNSGVRLICNWVGTYTQAGRFGAATGTTTCEDNVPAAFTITDLQINAQSFSARFTAQEPAPGNCRAEGSIVGVRR